MIQGALSNPRPIREEHPMKAIILTAAATLICLLVAIRYGSANEPESKGDSPFVGKLVTITIKERGSGAALENVELRKLGSREFLVGTTVGADERYEAIKGKKQWIAVDSILAIYEFKNLEDMQ